MKSLNDMESADMILSLVERKLTYDEFNLPPNKLSIHDVLQNEESLSKCCGFPFYLNKLAQLIELNKLTKINIQTYIPTKHNRAMTRHKKQESNVDSPAKILPED